MQQTLECPALGVGLERIALPCPLVLPSSLSVEDEEIMELERKQEVLEGELQTTKCTCDCKISPFCKESSRKIEFDTYNYYVVDLPQIQNELHRSFDHLGVIYSVLKKSPNRWFTRTEMAIRCCNILDKQKNSYLNNLSKEFKALPQNIMPSDPESQLHWTRWPTSSFIIGRKKQGKPQYLFYYHQQ